MNASDTDGLFCSFLLHALSLCYFSHLGFIQTGISLYSRITQVTVHTVNLCQVAAAADRTHIHLQFLMAAVVTVSQRQIYSLIKAHLHRPAHQSTDGFFIVADGVFHILDLSSVAQFPETVLQILLFNRRNVLCHMTMEAVAHILPVRHIFNDAVLFTELLYLKAAEIFRRSRINGIQIAILFLKFLNLFIDMLQNLQRKLSIFYQRLLLYSC